MAHDDVGSSKPAPGRRSPTRREPGDLGMRAVPTAFALLVRRSVSLVALALASLSACAGRSDAQRASREGAPRLMLWAWERPEDLRFLGRDDVGVAFLACTVNLRADTETVSPRRQPLRLPDNTWRTAVVRIASVPAEPGSLSPAQRARIVDEALRVSRLPQVRGVQIDFDAGKSQRAGYRQLLAELRSALPSSMPLSMTALASWCVFDTWVAGDALAVDEVVPMLFTMGADSGPVWRSLDETGDFRSSVCQSAVGVRAGERIPSFATSRRVYAFSGRPWDQDGWQAVKEGVSR